MLNFEEEPRMRNTCTVQSHTMRQVVNSRPFQPMVFLCVCLLFYCVDNFLSKRIPANQPFFKTQSVLYHMTNNQQHNSQRIYNAQHDKQNFLFDVEEKLPFTEKIKAPMRELFLNDALFVNYFCSHSSTVSYALSMTFWPSFYHTSSSQYRHLSSQLLLFILKIFGIERMNFPRFPIHIFIILDAYNAASLGMWFFLLDTNFSHTTWGLQKFIIKYFYVLRNFLIFWTIFHKR